jgi:hypothetical protein
MLPDPGGELADRPRVDPRGRDAGSQEGGAGVGLVPAGRLDRHQPWGQPAEAGDPLGPPAGVVGDPEPAAGPGGHVEVGLGCVDADGDGLRPGVSSDGPGVAQPWKSGLGGG